MAHDSSRTFRDIIAEWPSLDALAADMADIGVKADRVSKWKQRDSIPADYWLPLVEAGERRGIRISYDELAALAARVTRAAPEAVSP